MKLEDHEAPAGPWYREIALDDGSPAWVLEYGPRPVPAGPYSCRFGCCRADHPTDITAAEPLYRCEKCGQLIDVDGNCGCGAVPAAGGYDPNVGLRVADRPVPAAEREGEGDPMDDAIWEPAVPAADDRERLAALLTDDVLRDMPTPWYDESKPDWTETREYLLDLLAGVSPSTHHPGCYHHINCPQHTKGTNQ